MEVLGSINFSTPNMNSAEFSGGITSLTIGPAGDDNAPILTYFKNTDSSSIVASTVEASVSLGCGAFISQARTVAANYPLVAFGDFAVYFNANSTNLTATLPSANTTWGEVYVIKKIDSSGHTVTVNTVSGLIDGSSSLTLSTQYQYIVVQSDGSNWQIISKS